MQIKQNNNIGIWIKASRLRTLPLAFGGILLGGFLAAYEFHFSLKILVLALLTALFLQILSNFANDYGDFVKGTDQAADRTDRAMASGDLSIKSMKIALWIVSFAALFCGILLLVSVFHQINIKFLFWLIIGLIAITASIKYTIGKNAYGYKGLGDLFVLLFFGPVAVGGTYYLMYGLIAPNIFIPSIAYGLLCVSVLNINNLRDINEDKKAGKKTIVVRLGYKKSIWYQYILFASAIVLFMLFARLTDSLYDNLIVILFGTIYYFITTQLIEQSTDLKKYNLALKRVSITNLILVISLGFSWLL